ncbi:Oidioi.mRNA.OKI2018_I69.XSR.g15293.t1.cds [Oikopleura dioica]|uniref:Oidioi.mRNA.OKI2018_I69.XSR.g15293.t1.cds n=1 Tax=Oikopleura dioica TaxID=34765 RepID=A0ABN7SCD8_OIKDI|nr:Oidioi.mRNA.OKI2018_I69.XSR.g15293.t1.cds [Oikopleura dioica]
MSISRVSRRFYIQGQNGIRKNEREYFYRINHQGQLFLHDAKVKNFITCFKDPVFLNFFYKRIRPVREKEARHEGFNWISPCGHESNFIQVDLLPVIFDKIDTKNHLIDSRNTLH